MRVLVRPPNDKVSYSSAVVRAYDDVDVDADRLSFATTSDGSNQYHKHVTMSQLLEEIRTLLRRMQCQSREKECTYCGRLGSHWPPLQLQFGSSSNTTTTTADGRFLEDSSSPSGRRGTPPTALCTLTFSKHFRSTICTSTINLQIRAFGYTEAELWQAMAPMIHRIQLSSLPPTMNADDEAATIQVLELRAKGRIPKNSFHGDDDDNWLNDDGNSSLGGGDDDDDDERAKKHEEDPVGPSALPLFTPTELETLLTILVRSSSSPPTSSNHLQILDLTRCSFENLSFDLLFDAIAQSPALVDVSLKDCDLATTCLRRSDENYFTTNDLNGSNASSSSCLRDLTITGCVLGEDAIQCLRRLLLNTTQRLQHLVLVKNDLPLHAGKVVAESLMDHISLESLNLSGLDGGKDAIEAIGRLLQSSPNSTVCRTTSLKRLNLSENPQLIDVTPLARALKINTTLMELDLSLNRLVNMGALAEALCQNHQTTLKRLVLSKVILEDDDDNSSDDDGDEGSPTPSISVEQSTDTETKSHCCSFFAGIANTKVLQFLNLSYVQLPVSSMKELAESLRHNNSSVQSLQLNDLDRSFEPAELHLLFQSLRDNTTLKSLEVGRNPLTITDIEALVSSLVINRSLEALTLSGCDLTDDLLLPLAHRLTDFWLMELDLSFNAIGKLSVGALLQNLRSNSNKYRIQSMALYNSCWSIGGPTNFECDGFAQENTEIQNLLRAHRGSGWAFRIEHYGQGKDFTRLYQLLRNEVFCQS